MTSGIMTILYPVADVAKAKALFSGLAGTPHTDGPYYVGFKVGEQEVGLVPDGAAQGLTGAVAYWHVDDLDARLAEMRKQGARVTQPPRAVGGGRRVAIATDADGNLVGLLQDG